MKKIETGQTRGIIRKTDNLGRIVIPIEFRNFHNIDVKDNLEIFLIEDGIFIRKEMSRNE